MNEIFENPREKQPRSRDIQVQNHGKTIAFKGHIAIGEFDDFFPTSAKIATTHRAKYPIGRVTGTAVPCAAILDAVSSGMIAT